jgi:hypothetical protein
VEPFASLLRRTRPSCVIVDVATWDTPHFPKPAAFDSFFHTWDPVSIPCLQCL